MSQFASRSYRQTAARRGRRRALSQFVHPLAVGTPALAADPVMDEKSPSGLLTITGPHRLVRIATNGQQLPWQASDIREPVSDQVPNFAFAMPHTVIGEQGRAQRLAVELLKYGFQLAAAGRWRTITTRKALRRNRKISVLARRAARRRRRSTPGRNAPAVQRGLAQTPVNCSSLQLSLSAPRV
jgi:hypothetical protein